MAIKVEQTATSRDANATAIASGIATESRKNPLKVTRRIIDQDYVRSINSFILHTAIYSTGNGATTSMGYISAGSSRPDWKGVTKGTLAANTWSTGTFVIYPSAGSVRLVKKITIDCTDDAQFLIRKGLSGQEAITRSLTGTFQHYLRDQPNAAGGQVVFDFTSNPLRVPYGEIVEMFYARSTAGATNFYMTAEYEDIPNAVNFDAQFLQGVIGDSFGRTTEVDGIEYFNNQGTIQGMWSLIVYNFLKNSGIECVLSNLSIGGTTTQMWAWKAKTGLFRNWKPDLLLVNCGINDSSTLASARDALFKGWARTVITSYFLERPDGCLIWNQITDTDIAANNVNITTGTYAGMTTIQAIRLQLTEVVTELKLANPTWDLVIAQTTPANTYLATDASNFIEVTAGTRIHPNTTVGQPKLAVKIIEALQTTAFYSANSN